MSKKVNIKADVDTTTLAVAVSSAPGSAGAAVAYTLASSKVTLTNTSGACSIQYKVGQGVWMQLGRDDGIEIPADLRVEQLYLRRAGYEGGSASANVVIDSALAQSLDFLPVAQAGGNIAVDYANAVISAVTSGWSITVDPTVTFAGRSTLKITATAGAADVGNATLTIPTTWLGGAKRICFAVRAGDSYNQGGNDLPVQMRFNYSAGSQQIHLGYATGNVCNGDWMEGTVFDQDATGTGHVAGTAQWAKVAAEEFTSITLTLPKRTGAAVSVPCYVSCLYLDPYETPTLTLFFDDQFTGQYKYARPLLNGLGLPVSLAICPYFFNDYPSPGAGAFAGCMTEAQLLQMCSEGHEAIGHTGAAGPGGVNGGWDNTVKYPDGTEYAGVLADELALQSWMNARGLTRGSKYAVVGFTNGLVNTQSYTRRQNITNALKASGVKRVRQLGTYFESFYGCAQEAALITPGVRMVAATDTAATINGIVDQIIARGGWSGLVFHDFVLSGASGNQVNVSVLKEILTYIAAKVAAGQLRVKLFSDAMAEVAKIPVPR